MADDSEEKKIVTGESHSASKKPLKAASLISAAAQATSEVLCTPEHQITEDSPSRRAGPLHSPSFTSSPSAAVASSEVSKDVAFCYPQKNLLHLTHVPCFLLMIVGRERCGSRKC
jgi:hypothetical protein